jgi:hypothetical protein
VRLLGEDAGSDSWYASIDGSTPQPVSPPALGTWSWAAGGSYPLAAGQHVVQLGGLDPQAAADRLLLTDDPGFLPTEQPDVDVTPPAATSDLQVQAVDDGIVLSWSNPADPDLERVVVRYRTDGAFPSNPADGFPLLDRPAAPGEAESFVHGGVAGGVVHRYGVFAFDAAGNASAATQAEGQLPEPPEPPETVEVD